MLFLRLGYLLYGCIISRLSTLTCQTTQDIEQLAYVRRTSSRVNSLTTL
jgi:hypothetical protein